MHVCPVPERFSVHGIYRNPVTGDRVPSYPHLLVFDVHLDPGRCVLTGKAELCEMDGNEITPLDIRVHNCLHLLGITILYYDFFLTFSREVTYVWSKPKLISSSWPFLLNRYFSVFAGIAINIGNFTPFNTVKSCQDYALFRQLVIIFAQLIVCYILTARTYALWSRDRRVLLLILCVSALLLSLSCWAMGNQKAAISISHGCHAASSKSTAIRLAVAWECLFSFDCMIFTLTLYKSYKEVSRSQISTLNDLFVLIARDGAIYFAVMACANVANTLTFYFWTPALRGALSTAASSVSVSMMSRVMLNLQERASYMRTASESYGSSTDESTTFLFTSRINMSLQFNHTVSTAEASSENHHANAPDRSPASRMPLSNHGHMTTIYEVIELRDVNTSSNYTAPGSASLV